MARISLNNGDIWSEEVANAAGFPRLDGADAFGSGPKVIDDWLNDEPDQIKARFYGWLNRVRVSTSGLIASYTGASILLMNGTQVSLSAGTITLPANTTSYIFINNAGVVSHATSLPGECIPLALAVSGVSSVSSLLDLRYQVAEQVRTFNASNSGTFDIGDIKESARLTPSTGWVFCDGSLYNDVDYPLASAAIGRVHSLAGDSVGTFRVPNLADRVTVGVSGTKALGSKGGAETVKLSVANLAKHSHTTSEDNHTHSVNDFGHGHNTNDAGHRHPILAQDFNGDGATDSLINKNTAITGEDRGNFGYIFNNGVGTPLMQPVSSNVSVQAGGSNINLNGSKTNLTIRETGESTAHENMQPYVALNKFIRMF